MTSDVIHIFFQCLILKSTYRTNETFFSRTHRFGCELQTSDAGWSSKVQKDNNCAAHVRNGMVYLTVPMDRLFAHSVQMLQTERRRGVLLFFFNGTDLKMTDEEQLHKSTIFTYSLDEPSKNIHPVFRSNRLRTVRNNCLQSTRYQIVRIV